MFFRVITYFKSSLSILCLGSCFVSSDNFGQIINSPNQQTIPESVPIKKSGLSNVSVVQLIQGKALRRNYPNALPTLLSSIDERTTVKINKDPVIISSFEDEIIFSHPFIFINCNTTFLLFVFF